MGENRKLAAILAADVVGYSRLASEDEDRTLARLRALRSDLIDPTIAVHNGRVIKRTGDGALVEFRSVVDAVRCAIEVQNGMVERNAGVPQDRRIEFRIGIHLGDVVEESDGDLMGDGVNIASRLEGVAAPGAICLSEDAYRQVKARLNLSVADLGSTQLKNIAEPIRVYSLAVGAAGAKAIATSEPSTSRPGGSKSAKLSIAVLPFANMSGDTEQDYFADGISEDIITDLSKVAGLSVIARNSSFTYKGKNIDVRTVGRELGVTAVLEGSIRRAGNRVRINAQLIDARTGTHVWADRYDRDMTDIFALQDDVTRRIVEALRVALTPAESARIAHTPTRNIQAHDLFLRGREVLSGPDKTNETFERAVALFIQAIELDPDYAEPYAGLAHAYNHDFQNHWSGRTDSKELSAHYSRLALEKGPNLPYGHYMAALVKFWEKDPAGHREEVEKALALNPNFALAFGLRGVGNIYNGAPLEAIPDLEHALRLDPLQGHLTWHFIGSAYLLAGEYQKAVEAFRERIRVSPKTDLSRGLLIAALGHLGDVDEARRVSAELKEINPSYRFSEHVGRLPFSNPADAERIRQGYAKAAIPEYADESPAPALEVSRGR
ncbi:MULTISPECIES: adenylate/guanylate cyclase domain-containing protein [unclassified Mesorhizobium]|uniref:adenylate/guanylate cyclase domain-containing protein n=1 Tax=unclassified Mesorhizobium TaxID=325217 RepID=UPI001093C711|nr:MULTISPECIES: adenylate/guanylate cyclase domain-containing protein [unclassified Mesorhizobium]TGQ77112.1 adenylate/guanylate cyclase domain-containing protein [Mesorhizobium sp. M8A.F.Ca.ET.207.01.1.1]TGS38085.1 adenylate/guanylate cyclase domain-containing protein [Mesorhizobium sp. M8A.F.Ca.ET.182.01.1.1]TGS76539.1 adenylate/guanylate cyclase domain-containing protein [Mesorhizobium sp. M8A.F.Ca.ET.181.01.1.1]